MKLKIIKMYPNVKTPAYATKGSACFDIFARKCVDAGAYTATYSTGLKFDIPEGYVMKLYSRSGHGFNKNIRLANCVGIIDSDYRGEVMVKLTYDGDDRIDDLSGQRICQGMLERVEQVNFHIVSELSETDRGQAGFGSTDKVIFNSHPVGENTVYKLSGVQA